MCLCEEKMPNKRLYASNHDDRLVDLTTQNEDQSYDVY